jgi:hypothetical protein
MRPDGDATGAAESAAQTIRRVPTLCRAFLLITLVLGAGAPAAADPGAHLVVAEHVHEFGAVVQGTLVQHRFLLQNDGTGELHIDDVAAPCGCTVAVLSDHTVPPGGAAELHVTFDTARFGGRKTKTVSVSTDDPDQPVVDLTLTGEVLPEVVADPPVLYLGRIRPGTEAIGGVRVVGTSGEAVRVFDARVDNPVLNVTIEPPEPPSVEGSPGQQVVVRIAPEARRGRFSDTIRVSTSHPAVPLLEIPIFGSVESSVVVTPPHVTFRASAGGRRGEQGLHVRNMGTMPIQISGIRVTDLVMDYAVRTIRPGYDFEIHLRLQETPFSSTNHGFLYINTTHPEEPELVVPVYTMAQDASGL